MKTQLLKIPFKEYCELKAINSSKLKDFFADPKLFYKTYITKTIPLGEEERYFVVGRAIHCMVLEPEKFGASFMVGERRKSTTIGKTNHSIAKFADLQLIDEDEYALCCNIAAELPKQNAWYKYDKDAIIVHSEVVIIVEINGIILKVMLDRCIEHADVVYVRDVKSTSAKNSNEFDKSLTEYDYLIQYAMYKFVVECHFKKRCVFDFVFCGKDEPYNIAFISPEPYHQIGHELFQCVLSRYIIAQNSGIWYPEQVQEREAIIPKWSMQKYMDYIAKTPFIEIEE